MKNIFSIGLELDDDSSSSGNISYKDFKNLFTLGIGSLGDQPYASKGEFYQALAEKHGSAIFKPFEALVDKLCVKLGSGDAAKGQEMLKNAVISIQGSFDSKNGLHAELFSCMFKDLSGAPDSLKDTTDKNPADILKFLDQRLRSIVGTHVLGASKNAEKPVSSNAQASAQQAPASVKQAQASGQQAPAPDLPLNKELAESLIFTAKPGAQIDGSILIRMAKDTSGFKKAVTNFMNKQAAPFIQTHGSAAVASMVSKLSGIPEDALKASYDLQKALVNCLFIKGSESANKLIELLNNNGTAKGFEKLVNERLQEFEKYVQDPSKIPNPVSAAVGSDASVQSRQPAPGPYKCSVDTAKFANMRDGDNLRNCGLWLSTPAKPGTVSALDIVRRLDPISVMGGMEHFLMNVTKCKHGEIDAINNKRPAGSPIIDRTRMAAYLALEEIADDFVSKFGPDAIKRIVESVGGTYDPKNSTYVLDLARVVFCNNEVFEGNYAIASLASKYGQYSDNDQGLVDIFIDGINAYAEKLGLKPLDKPLELQPPVNKEIAEKLIFKPEPGADYDNSFTLGVSRDNTGLGEAQHKFFNQADALIESFGVEHTASVVSKLTGIPADNINVSRILRFAMLNSLFIEGTESANKLRELLNNNGTEKDLSALIQKEMENLKKYLQDPAAIPNVISAEPVIKSEYKMAGNIPGPYKCSFDTAKFNPADKNFTPNLLAFDSQGSVEPPSRLIAKLDKEASNVNEMLENLEKCKNGQYNEVNRNRTGNSLIKEEVVRPYFVLEEITNDFISKFGKEAVKQIVESIGGKYEQDNSTDTIELARALIRENREFDVHLELSACVMESPGAYRPNLAGFADIFIDAINVQASKLGLQPLNK
ncbi:hypothetical protein [Succinimonas sp.]|uniref:hypothetical protein n=1 Tax=Succinimonas sp. TaxID=1936151 RepID=UPI003866C2A8